MSPCWSTAFRRLGVRTDSSRNSVRRAAEFARRFPVGLKSMWMISCFLRRIAGRRGPGVRRQESCFLTR